MICIPIIIFLPLFFVFYPMKVLIFEFRIDKDDIEQIVNINLDSKIISNFL
jgi:hypothetical protein